MTTYVLIHGGWHGGWCWRELAPLLRTAGHEVYTPTLTGLGERVHLAHSAIDLDTHIQDVVNVLWYEDLDGVVLVGHSYGGMVLTGVAHRVPERLSHLVYLDAFVPRDGQCLLDLLPPERQQQFRDQARATGDGWRVPSLGVERFGVTDEEDVSWVGARLVDQPLQTFEQPVECVTATADALPRTYIYCTRSGLSFGPFAQRAQSEPGWRYRELGTGHDAMITVPQDLANLLLEVAGGTR